MPDYPIFFWFKGQEETSKNLYVNVKLSGENNVFPLYNDGQHNDIEVDDYFQGGDGQVSRLGEYDVEICEGDSITNLCCVNTGETLNIKDLELIPLFPEHNNRDADRINMILIGSGYSDINVFKGISKEILSFNGEPTITTNPYSKPGSEEVFITKNIEWGICLNKLMDLLRI